MNDPSKGKLIVAVAIDVPEGIHFKSLEAQVRGAVAGHVAGVRGVFTETVSYGGHRCEWWETIARRGDLSKPMEP